MIIKRFSDNSLLEYDRGSFDDWCVYYTNSSGIRKPPRDTDYFEFLCQLANEFTVEKVYGDYVQVYNWTGNKVKEGVLNNITTLSASYGEKALAVNIVFSILYLAMISSRSPKSSVSISPPSAHRHSMYARKPARILPSSVWLPRKTTILY